MQENKLYLQFKDNKEKIEFDLNKNTVFFGNNGKGKTRILQTINSLYQLAKEKKKENFSKIIDSMNLEKLEINGVDYDSLFLANEDLKRVERKSFKRFLVGNRIVFENLYLLLDELRINFFNSSASRKYRINQVLDHLDRIIKNPSHPSIIPSGFGRWMNDLYIVVSSFENTLKYNMDFDLDNNQKHSINFVEEVLMLTSHLKEQYQLYELKSNNINLTNNLETNRNKIMANLSLKSARYITTDNIDVINIIKKIELEIDVINNSLKIYFWNDFTVVNKFNELVQKRNNLLGKITKFNDIISKYANIKIELQNISELVFLKNSEEMTFDKLSSGEKKITFLFLEILLNDVDIYLIDEPELSLSLNYQNKIITDLHVLTKGKTLFIATHAPYIYEDFMAIEGNISKEV